MKYEQVWRIQIDDRGGRRHQIYSHLAGSAHAQELPDRFGGHKDTIRTQPDSEIDEVVIDNWFHIEMMDDRRYWMRVAGLDINVTVGKDGKAKTVTVELDREDGVTYRGDYDDG